MHPTIPTWSSVYLQVYSHLVQCSHLCSNQCFAEQICYDEKVCEALCDPVPEYFHQRGERRGNRKIGKEMKVWDRGIRMSVKKRGGRLLHLVASPIQIHLEIVRQISEWWPREWKRERHRKIQKTCFGLQTSEIKMSLFMRRGDEQRGCCSLHFLFLHYNFTKDGIIYTGPNLLALQQSSNPPMCFRAPLLSPFLPTSGGDKQRGGKVHPNVK